MPTFSRQATFLWGVALFAIILSAAYAQANHLPYPRFDQWFHSIHVAENAVDGTLSYQDIIRPNFGHRIVFPSLTTALVAITTHWNLSVEVWAGFLALVGAYVMVIRMAHHAFPKGTAAMAAIGAVLMFSLRHHTNLVWGFNALQWFYMSFGIAACGAALFTVRAGYRAVLLMALATGFSLFSSGGGIVLVPLVTLFMWVRGYRRVGPYILWLVACAGMLWLYFHNMEQGVERVSPESINFYWGRTTSYIVTMMTGQFFPNPDIIPPIAFVALFIVASALGVVNLWWLARQQSTRQAAEMVAFLAGVGVAASVLTSLGRAVTMWWGSQSRLFSMSVYAWLALAFSAVIVLMMLRPNGRRERLVWAANAGLLAFLVVNQAYVNIYQLTHEHVEGYVGHLDPEDERCYWSYLITRSPSCIMELDPLNVTEGEIDGLFARRLAHFRTYDGMNPIAATLPDIYRADEPVIVVGETPEQQAAVINYRDHAEQRTQLVPMHVLARVMRGDEQANPALAQDSRVVAPGEQPNPTDQLRPMLALAERVWYLRAAVDDDYDAPVRDLLAEDFEMIRVEGVHWRTTGYDDVALYLRRPTPLLTFGETIRLIAWQLRTPIEISACHNLQTDMLWYSQGTPAENYSLALVLADASGVGQLRTDIAPGGYTTSLWEAGAFYRAQDVLTIPCDFPPGEYSLLTGLYVPGTGEALPIRNPDGADVGALAYLTTIRVLKNGG